MVVIKILIDLIGMIKTRIITIDEYTKNFGKIERINFARRLWKLPNKKMVIINIPYIKTR